MDLLLMSEESNIQEGHLTGTYRAAGKEVNQDQYGKELCNRRWRGWERGQSLGTK